MVLHHNFSFIVLWTWNLWPIDSKAWRTRVSEVGSEVWHILVYKSVTDSAQPVRNCIYSRLNLVRFSNFLHGLISINLTLASYRELNFWHFERKKILKNHKFLSKIGFFLKKGWFYIEQPNATRRNPNIIKLQTFLHSDLKKFLPGKSWKKSYVDLKIFIFSVKSKKN